MWRLVVAVSLLLTLALGTVAEAKCQVCVEGVSASKGDGSAHVLRFTARAVHAAAFPMTATAVVMQVDGAQPQAKCVNVSLRKIDEANGLATYSGAMNTIYLNGSKVLTGRVDIGGDIHEFTTPLDGTPGKLQLVTAATAAQGSLATSPRPVAAVITPDPVPASVAPQAAGPAAPQTASAVRVPSPAEHPILYLGAIVILATLAGAFIDRRRALARATAV
jgi:hypothetical protein